MTTITMTQFLAALSANGISNAVEPNGIPTVMKEQFDAQPVESQTTILSKLNQDITYGNELVGLAIGALNWNGATTEAFFTQAAGL